MVYLGLLFILTLMLSSVVLSSKKAKGKSYSGRQSATSFLVMGAIVGTFVGGSSTMGTAQGAFAGGISAWWYTIGCSIGLLFFGLFFAKSIYYSGCTVLPEVVASKYGARAGVTMSLMSALGTLIGLTAQVLSGAALMETILGVKTIPALLIFMALVLLYVYIGGGVSLGYMGLVKTFLLLLGLGICGVVAYVSMDKAVLFSLPKEQYFNMFYGGATKHLSKVLSLAAGIITGQNYTSAIITGKDYNEARRGVYLSVIFGPIIGILCILVGFYMHLTAPETPSSMVLPLFISLKTPGFLAGCLEGALLFTLVGTTAGGVFATATTIYRGLLKEKIKDETKCTRLLILLFLLAISLFGMGRLGDMILNWSFLGVGLRGASSLLPVVLALYVRKRIGEKYLLLSMLAAPAFTGLGKLLLSSLSLEPIIYGLFGSLLFISLGLLAKEG